MPGRKPRTAIGRKFDRCTASVRRRGRVTDPEAVCAATLNRAYPGALARARRNPTAAERFRDCVDANNGKTVQDPADYCADKLAPRKNPAGDGVVVVRAGGAAFPELYVVQTRDVLVRGRLRVAPGYRVKRAVSGRVWFGRAWFKQVGKRWVLHAVDTSKTVQGRVTSRGFELPDAEAARLSHVDHAAIARYVPRVAARANPCGCGTKRR